MLESNAYTLPITDCADNVVAAVVTGLAKVPTLPFNESNATAGAIRLLPINVAVIEPLEITAAEVVPVTVLPKSTVAVLLVLVAVNTIAFPAIVPVLASEGELLVATL